MKKNKVTKVDLDISSSDRFAWVTVHWDGIPKCVIDDDIEVRNRSYFSQKPARAQRLIHHARKMQDILIRRLMEEQS